MMEPVAYAAFEPNGHIRIWSTDPGKVESYDITPLVRLSDAEARIAELEALVTASEKDRYCTNFKLLKRAEAAEALLKEAGPAIEKAMAILRELEGKLPHALGMAVGDAIDQLRFPVSAARAVSDKIGVKDE